MKNRNKNTIWIVIIATMVGIIGLATISRYDNYPYSNFNEVLEKRYKGYDTQFIKSNDYYFIVGVNESETGGVIELVYQKASGEFEFFSDGIYPEVSRFKSLYKSMEERVNSPVDSFRLYKNGAVYILIIEDFFTDEEVGIVDNYEELKPIVEKNSRGDYFNLYWFKTLTNISDDYTMYIEINGNRELLVKGSDIKELLD